MTVDDSATVRSDFVPEAIHNQVAFKLLVSGFLTGLIGNECLFLLPLPIWIGYMDCYILSIFHNSVLLANARRFLTLRATNIYNVCTNLFLDSTVTDKKYKSQYTTHCHKTKKNMSMPT